MGHQAINIQVNTKYSTRLTYITKKKILMRVLAPAGICILEYQKKMWRTLYYKNTHYQNNQNLKQKKNNSKSIFKIFD